MTERTKRSPRNSAEEAGAGHTFASFYAQTGTSSELTTANLHDEAMRQKVGTRAEVVGHHGDTTLTYLAKPRRHDDAGQAAAHSPRSLSRRTAASPGTWAAVRPRREESAAGLPLPRTPEQDSRLALTPAG